MGVRLTEVGAMVEAREKRNSKQAKEQESVQQMGRQKRHSNACSKIVCARALSVRTTGLELYSSVTAKMTL